MTCDEFIDKVGNIHCMEPLFDVVGIAKYGSFAKFAGHLYDELFKEREGENGFTPQPGCDKCQFRSGCVCNRFPAEVTINKMHWCGEFKARDWK